ncbi:MAG: hypothetical protein GY943_33085, partial [Chloroflexi bacterium]|nr:hypothetical protein [Chloroflexota bacterium]
PTATTTPSSTPTPIERMATPTLPPVAAAAGDSADHYRLKTWSDTEAATLASRMTEYADGFTADWELHAWYGDRGRSEIIEIGREFMLRYPTSPYLTEVEWQMVDASTYYPDKTWDELLAQLIANDLNTGNITLETLDTYLQTYGLQIGLRDCQNCDTSIPNLLGDGQQTHLFLIERLVGQFDGGMLIAIWQDVDETFVVTPILSRWAAFSRVSGGYNDFEARHISDDTQPELVIELWGQNGSMIWTSLYMYQWNGEQFVQLAGTPFIFNDDFYQDQWEFVEGDEASRLQVVRTYDNSTTIYEWTGDSYEAVEFTQDQTPPDPTNVYFASEWIHQEIEHGNYTEVIDYLNDALQKPASSYDPSGTQYHRAMRFLLGMNYVYLKDEEMARSVFEGLRDEDSSPELIGFSQVAGVFLEHYDGLESAYAGCNAAYAMMLATDLERSGINELMPLCAFDTLFIEKLNQYDGTGDLFDYVNAAEIINAQQHDLNGNGRLDWIFAVSHPTLNDQTDVEVWAILQTDAGAEVVKLTTLWAGEEKIEEVLVGSHPFPLLDTPLIAILANGNFRLLQLIQKDEGWETRLQPVYYITDNYSLQMVEDDLQLDRLFNTNTLHSGIDRITYQWDAELEEFVEVSRHAANSLGIPFEEALDLAETLILENSDFAAAIPILTTIINEFDPTSESAWHFSLPKTLYLLGLAHEMQGNETQAVAAYWRLWHDHPTDPYALMAAAKLEEK